MLYTYIESMHVAILMRMNKHLYVHTIEFQLTLTLESRFEAFLLKCENGDSAFLDIFCLLLGVTVPVRVNLAPKISRTSRLPLATSEGE